MLKSPSSAPIGFAALAAASLLLGSLSCFQADPPKPEFTELQPASGHPGTEVLLKGKDLDKVDDVRCEGRLLDPDHIVRLGSTGLRVRLPEDLQDTVTLAVSNKGGSAELAFAVKPSRAAVLARNLLVEEGPHGHLLDFPATRRAQDPPGLRLPLAPQLELEGSQGTVASTIHFNLPDAFHLALPPALLDRAKAWGASAHEIEILCVSQGIGAAPHSGAVFRFQPRLWASPHAADAKEPPAVKAALFEADGPIRFHTGGQDHRDVRISTKPNTPLPSVTGVNPRSSSAFWSLTVEEGRAAATLHLLLDAGDQAALAAIAGHPGTFGAFLRSLRESPALSASRPIKHLLALFRPIADGYGRVAESARTRTTICYHNGSGFSGVQSVTLDGKPVATFTALTDGLLEVKLPRNATGKLVVKTEFGESAPFPAKPEAAARQEPGEGGAPAFRRESPPVGL